MHIGCSEIFAGDRVRGLHDLRGGKKIALYAEESVEKIWFASIMAYIGLDPDKDVEWVIHPYETWADLLTKGEVDAVLLWPPDAQVFREQKIGHVILNSTTDEPWRNYFCCMVAANQNFMDKHPVATKRALRAMLKATDMCALEPKGAAQALTDAGFPFDYDRAVQVFNEIPYGQWREYDPEDTMRFYSLRLRDLGFVEQLPDSLIAAHTDWRFLGELKNELKA